MSTHVFRSLCEQLGYDPHSVLSVRVNSSQVVVVTKNELGHLRVTNYEQAEDGLRRAAQGPPFVSRTRHAS